MDDVTGVFASYRECARHLWNTYYRPLLGERPDWDLCDEFSDVAAAIFTSLVLRQLGLPDRAMSAEYVAEPVALDCFRVIPRIELGTPIMINREQRRSSGYWDYPLQRIRPDEADLRFLRFFDFDVCGYREFRYMQVVVRASASLPELVGRVALIEVENARVVVDGAGG